MNTVGVLCIVVPVYNDWQSFAVLARNLRSLPLGGLELRVVAVDDGSHPSSAGQFIGDGVDVVRLPCNVGHQRAIALGLCVAVSFNPDWIGVMDSDGEDDPRYIHGMLSALGEAPGGIVVAQRRRRSESIFFRLFYALYRFAFATSTGVNIDFGNYCMLSTPAARRLIHMPDTWNHLAAAVLKARLPIVKLPTERSSRYFGASTMSFVSLVAHGLSAISVFSDRFFVRILVGASLLGGGSVGLGGVILCIKLFTNRAIPGWSSLLEGILVLLFLQSLIFIAIAAVLSLASRSATQTTPVQQANILGLVNRG